MATTLTRRMLGTWATALVLAAMTAHAASAAPVPVGVVAEYRPAFARYTLQRAPAAVAARIGTVVMAGDKINLPKDGVLIVQLADRSSRRFSGPGTFEVPAVESGNRVMAVLASIPALFEDQQRRYGTAATRGGSQCGQPDAVPDPIEAPILADGARVVAGRRDLQLAWRGGCKPYRVELRTADGRPVAVYESLVERRLRLAAVDLPAGRYAVVISDAGGRRLEAPLESIASAPTLPEEIARGEGAIGDVSRGVWWAGQPDANWRLAAYEALRPSIEAGDVLAASIGESLLTGRAPPP